MPVCVRMCVCVCARYMVQSLSAASDGAYNFFADRTDLFYVTSSNNMVSVRYVHTQTHTHSAMDPILACSAVCVRACVCMRMRVCACVRMCT